jgi:8-oxo-dGTP pyrophosphatase MutT (NUDIX family)
MQEEMTQPKTEGAAPRPATTVLLLRPSQTGDAASPLEVFMVVRHHQIDSFSGALVFPGGKLARKRGQRALIGAADLKGIEERWRAKLAKDEASIVDMVEAEDLEIATELMTPYAHWITPTFVPKRFDTWFFLAEAPEDQIALHDGSESTDSVWIGPQEAIEEAKAGKRTLVHATTKNLELLAEGKTVAGAIAAARTRKIVTVLPWVEVKDGKKFLHIPEGAGYRNLIREMPAAGGVPQTGR